MPITVAPLEFLIQLYNCCQVDKREVALHLLDDLVAIRRKDEVGPGPLILSFMGKFCSFCAVIAHQEISYVELQNTCSSRTDGCDWIRVRRKRFETKLILCYWWGDVWGGGLTTGLLRAELALEEVLEPR